jgi:16S rRNA (cytidine1402-2'-O)-methyltransferase
VTKPGKLVLAARPIGNYKDSSLRLIEALKSADLIAAEDTRKLKRLLSDLEINTSAKIVSYFEENEISKIGYLLAEVKDGKVVLLISDAGTVTISDPGFKLVQAAVRENIKLEVLPGASAPIAALTLSGFATDEFIFIGFLPRKKSLREQKYFEIKESKRTFIFFESPRRILNTLEEMNEILPSERSLVIARELTKTYEEIVRGNLTELITWAKGEVLGEITVVVDGASENPEAELPQAIGEVLKLVQLGVSHKDAVNQVASSRGLAKRALYQATLELAHE